VSSTYARSSFVCAFGSWVAATEGEIRDASGRNRQPVRDEPLGKRREQRVLWRDARERERPDECRLDKAKPTRGKRDQSEKLGAGIAGSNSVKSAEAV